MNYHSNHRRTAHPTGSLGFTMIEILVVLTIVSIVAAALGVRPAVSLAEFRCSTMRPRHQRLQLRVPLDGERPGIAEGLKRRGGT